MVEFVIRKNTFGGLGFSKQYDDGRDPPRRPRKDERRIRLPPDLEKVELQVLVMAYKMASEGVR